MVTNKVLVTGGSGFIGTHCSNWLKSTNIDFLNIDIVKPRLQCYFSHWRQCDIKSLPDVISICEDFQPTHVIHLAAKANLQGTTIDDFPDNTLGTSNLVECVNGIESIKKFAHVSTQYVVQPGVFPPDDEYLSPYTAYGESKAEGERIVRAGCTKCWTILRPSNIWGPMHPFFPYELWPYLQKRFYMHPGMKPIIKHYGYVENAVDQIMAILLSDQVEDVCGQVFYITDPPIDNVKWMDGFSKSLSGKSVRRMPIALWKGIAIIGDLLNQLGIRFPMSTARLFRLTVNEHIPYEKTIEFVGKPRIGLEDGVQRSIEWYNERQQ